MISKRVIAISAVAAALAFGSPAQAEIFKYRQGNGAILTINTANGTGTMIGRDINVSFTSNDLKNFTGGANPTGKFNLDDLDGYRIINGRRAYNNRTHQQQLNFRNNGRVNLWSHWGNNTRYGDYITRIRHYTPPTGSSGGSTSGGSTGGSTGGGSTGGTDVPAPGMMLLFGMGAGALAWRRRRNKKA